MSIIGGSLVGRDLLSASLFQSHNLKNKIKKNKSHVVMVIMTKFSTITEEIQEHTQSLPLKGMFTSHYCIPNTFFSNASHCTCTNFIAKPVWYVLKCSDRFWHTMQGARTKG